MGDGATIREVAMASASDMYTGPWHVHVVCRDEGSKGVAGTSFLFIGVHVNHA